MAALKIAGDARQPSPGPSTRRASLAPVDKGLLVDVGEGERGESDRLRTWSLSRLAASPSRRARPRRAPRCRPAGQPGTVSCGPTAGCPPGGNPRCGCGLGLFEVENVDAISGQNVVGDGKLFIVVAVFAEVHPAPARSRHAALAIADRGQRSEAAKVRLFGAALATAGVSGGDRLLERECVT